MSDKRRHRQIADSIRDELVTIVRKDLSDPNLEKVGMITFSGLDLSDDIRTAVVWCAFMGKEEKDKHVQEALKGLNRSASYIHRLLIKRLPMKLHPRLEFKFDSGFDHAAKVGKALKEAAEVEAETLRVRSESGNEGSDDPSED